MAKRVARIYGGKPYVNAFILDEKIYKSNDLNVKKFENPTGKWAIFVLNNRDRKFQDKKFYQPKKSRNSEKLDKYYVYTMYFKCL